MRRRQREIAGFGGDDNQRGKISIADRTRLGANPETTPWLLGAGYY
jgi:hypothetical protein